MSLLPRSLDYCSTRCCSRCLRAVAAVAVLLFACCSSAYTFDSLCLRLFVVTFSAPACYFANICTHTPRDQQPAATPCDGPHPSRHPPWRGHVACFLFFASPAIARDTISLSSETSVRPPDGPAGIIFSKLSSYLRQILFDDATLPKQDAALPTRKPAAKSFFFRSPKKRGMDTSDAPGFCASCFVRRKQFDRRRKDVARSGK